MDRKSLGIHLINLLSSPQKFTLIGFLLAIPLTLVMYLLICEINSRGYFTKKEIYLNQYLRPLRHLREYIPKLQEFSLSYTIKFSVKVRELIDILMLIILAIFMASIRNFYSEIMQPLFVIYEGSKKIATGTLGHNIILDDTDKKGKVVGAFNTIADALIGKNQEITILNDRLKVQNMRIISELDLTRKIQHMLLPKNREIKKIIGLHTAGVMEAAEEVGGDYYDVLSHKSRGKIGMGDVTGYKWESGVLMIMFQRAFRTWLADNEPEQVKILSVINSVIYGNVHPMKFDKNASLALLEYQQGMLKLSGQHEEMIVVLCNGCVERFDRIDFGFPIGLDAEIAEFVAETTV